MNAPMRLRKLAKTIEEARNPFITFSNYRQVQETVLQGVDQFHQLCDSTLLSISTGWSALETTEELIRAGCSGLISLKNYRNVWKRVDQKTDQSYGLH
jgi:hypothetical protein